MVGSRDACFATEFLKDLASRLANRIQLITEGHKMYFTATEAAFGGDIDYSMLIKMYTKGNSTNQQCLQVLLSTLLAMEADRIM